MTKISDDFLKAASAKVGDEVYAVMKEDDGHYAMRSSIIESLDFIHGSAENPIFAGTTAMGHRFALIDKTGEISVTSNGICQIFRDKDKIHDFLEAERVKLETAHRNRMESLNAISLGLRKA